MPVGEDLKAPTQEESGSIVGLLLTDEQQLLVGDLS
jgi:hypothetical protein